MRVPPPDECLAKDRARTLRRNATVAETRLWAVLRQRPLGLPKFRRQMPFGPYILDFAAPALRLAVEIDGETHYVGDGPRRDQVRDDLLARHGWRVLRVLNADVLGNIEGVVAAIRGAAQPTDPHPNPLPEGEGARAVLPG